MLLLHTALLLSPAALADVAPEDTSESEDSGAEEEEEDDKKCSAVALPASLLGIGLAAFVVGWRRREDR